MYLQVQCNLYQNYSCLLSFINSQSDPKVDMEIQGTQNSQKNHEKELNWSTLNFHCKIDLNIVIIKNV